jgi:hypothetical protein
VVENARKMISDIHSAAFSFQSFQFIGVRQYSVTNYVWQNSMISLGRINSVYEEPYDLLVGAFTRSCEQFFLHTVSRLAGSKSGYAFGRLILREKRDSCP